MSNEHFDAALPINWSVDDTDGPIQGPLALAFLQGRRLALTLGENQVALLLGDGRLQAAFPAGEHELAIGPGGIDPDWRLLFLAPGKGLAVRWTAAAPLRCGKDVELALIGLCRLAIADARAFHDTFLAGVETVDATFVLVLIDRLVQATVAERLASSAGADNWTPASVQARLTSLGASDLADELAACGLACRQLALYTAQPPVDQERRSLASRVSGESVPMSGHSETLRRH